MSKRPRSPDGGADGQSKRRSRFADAPASTESAVAQAKAQIEARVAAISKTIEAHTSADNIASSTASALAQQQALALQAQVAAQLASVSSILSTAQKATANTTKKAAVHALRLDEQGREVDEFNNVVQQVAPQVKTLTANVLAEKAALAEKRKKENPYLAHRTVEKGPAVAGTGGVAGGTTDSIAAADSLPATGIDPRLALRSKRREAHLKRALNFVEQGAYAREEELLQQKEERRALAGYASGRKAVEKLEEGPDGEAEAQAEKADAAAKKKEAADVLTLVPELADADRVVPAMEWWDELYLPRSCMDAGGATISLSQMKKQLQQAAVASDNQARAVAQAKGKAQKAALLDSKGEASLFQPRTTAVALSSSTVSDDAAAPGAALTVEEFYKLLTLKNSKTFKYVQHPVAPKPLTGDPGEERPLPVYLTAKERKRIRKKAREEREQEKRDKQSMGLIPAAEPKFKLSNFMKVLGDQAVADPSKIEQKVIEQMRKREMNHEMRNQARKLTPQERKEKEKRRNIEDTSKLVHVAVFKVSDLSDKKKQFKIDVTAQQHHLSGTVLISTSKEVPTCLVVVEGGPRGIRVFSKLMTRRIPWKVASEAYTNPKSALKVIADYGGDDEDDEDEGEGEEQVAAKADVSAIVASLVTEPLIDPALNDCYLLWEGVLAKRLFTGFKFQEFRSAAAARKALEPKGAQHYWDMAVQHNSSSITKAAW